MPGNSDGHGPDAIGFHRPKLPVAIEKPLDFRGDAGRRAR
jgi:hypothetical protein